MPVLGPLVPAATVVVLDPDELAPDRAELHLHLGPIQIAPAGPDWGDAQIEQYMAESARGQIPVDYRTPNRQPAIPLTLGAAGAATFDSARSELMAKVALLQRRGGWLKRGDGLYADVVGASLKMPDQYPHLGVQADVILTLETLPDFYGDEIELTPAGGS